MTEEKELLMWGRHIMMGYANRPDATKKDMTEDGWLRLKHQYMYKKHQKIKVHCKVPFRSDLVTLCQSTMRTSMPSLAERRCERSIENSYLEHTHNFQIFIGLDHNCGRRKHSTSAHS